MKHLLTAALIATALASPVRGEVIEFDCVNQERPRDVRYLTIETELKLAVVDRFDLTELRFVDWRDNAITWQQRYQDQQNLEFFIFDEHYRLTSTNFRFRGSGTDHSIEEYVCIPMTIDLGRIMRDAAE
jgi:hypothetical protein